MKINQIFKEKEQSASREVVKVSLRPEERIKITTRRLQALKQKQPAVFWPWLGGLLVVGIVIVAIVTFSAWDWLNSVQSGIGSNQPALATISAVNVQRKATYADLAFTLLNVQYATSFSDDSIRVGPATARVALQIKNPTQNTVALAYYDIARLLVPKQQPITPTNLNLPATSKAGAVQSGWIDFPVARSIALSTLQLQLGNAATHETLVTVPVSGSYNAGQFNNRLYRTSSEMDYIYRGYLLAYHLNSVDVRYSYNGTEVQAGQQFYVLTFAVDNPNDVWIGPGYGFDYIRLVLNSNRPPIYNTLPNGFKANAHNVNGSVVYAAPAGLHSLIVAFLYQLSQGEYTYSVNL